MKKHIAPIAGIFLILGVLLGSPDSFSNLLDWSSAEIVGYNIATLVFLCAGIYLVAKAFRKTSTHNDI